MEHPTFNNCHPLSYRKYNLLSVNKLSNSSKILLSFLDSRVMNIKVKMIKKLKNQSLFREGLMQTNPVHSKLDKISYKSMVSALKEKSRKTSVSSSQKTKVWSSSLEMKLALNLNQQRINHPNSIKVPVQAVTIFLNKTNWWNVKEKIQNNIFQSKNEKS